MTQNLCTGSASLYYCVVDLTGLNRVHESSLTIKGGTQMHCVTTLFGRPSVFATRSRGRPSRQLHWMVTAPRCRTNEGSLAFKGGTQLHCVATLFGKLNDAVGGNRNGPIYKCPHSMSAWTLHGGSIPIKGGTQLHWVATLFGGLYIYPTDSSEEVGSRVTRNCIVE